MTLQTIGNPASVKGNFQYHDVIGLLSASAEGFSGPVSVAFGPDGNLYVASRGNPNQQEAVRITRCGKDGEYLGQVPGWGEEEGQFIWITDIAFNGDGKLFAAEEHTQRINVYDPSDFSFLYSFGQQGDGEGQWDRPSGIAFDSSDNLFVVDSLNHRIQQYDARGKFRAQWGEFGDAAGQFNMPWDIFIDRDDNIYVSDWRNDRIQKLTRDGKVLMVFGSSGDGENQFNRPTGVATDADGDIYVCDWMNDRVQVFDANANYKDTLIGHCGVSKWARSYLDANPEIEGKLELAKQNIEPKRRFYRPASVKVDTDGKVYVADCYRHRVQIYQKL
ncbi:MAG: NHL repeat-containing protein [Chloroflexi bacterium]|nr:NHL repeat-containing protein [Chloroflexota bacterium]MCH9039454.1 NHL repeat-containing protein [Chloroflexota bacterium]